MAGSLKKSVVCGNHSDVPTGSKQPPCQDRPLCGLFTLKVIPDSTCTRLRALHTAHLKKICVPHTLKTQTRKICLMGEMSVHLSVSLTLLHAYTHTHTPVLPTFFSRPSSHSWLGYVM